MDKKKSQKTARFKELISSYALAVTFIIITLVCYIVWFEGVNDQVLARSTETWGQFGDFFGGVSNPIIALLTLYWVMSAVKLQTEELKETTQALQDTSKAQVINTSLAALTAELRILQSEIDQLLSERSYYAELKPSPSGLYKTLEGKQVSGGVLEQIANANTQIINKRSEQNASRNKIKIYMAKVAPHIGAAEIIAQMSSN